MEENENEDKDQEVHRDEKMETLAKANPSLKEENTQSNKDSSRFKVKKNPIEKLETSDSPCTCSLKLGIYPLTTHKSEFSKVLDDIENMEINFHGPAGSNEQLLVKRKINEIKEKIAEYYYDKNCKVVAIPNNWTIPKNPSVIGIPSSYADEDFLNKHCEELLHHEFVRYAREKKKECLVINGFNSHDCLKDLLKKAKNSRGKNLFTEFNNFEMEIKDILGIKDISEKEFMQTMEEHNKWKEGGLNKKDVKTWLFKQEIMFYMI